MGTSAILSPAAGSEATQFTIVPDLTYLPQGFEQFYKQPFIYPLTFENLAAAGSVSDNITIDASSYFACFGVNLTVSDEATGLTVVATDACAVMVELKDSASSQYFQSSPFRASTMFGTGERPGYWLHRALIFRPASNIAVTATNLDPGNAWRLDFSFIGFQIFQLADQLEF